MNFSWNDFYADPEFSMPTRSEVVSLSDEWKIKLPDAYIDLLLQHAGKQPHPRTSPLGYLEVLLHLDEDSHKQGVDSVQVVRASMQDDLGVAPDSDFPIWPIFAGVQRECVFFDFRKDRFNPVIGAWSGEGIPFDPDETVYVDYSFEKLMTLLHDDW